MTETVSVNVNQLTLTEFANEKVGSESLLVFHAEFSKTT